MNVMDMMEEEKNNVIVPLENGKVVKRGRGRPKGPPKQKSGEKHVMTEARLKGLEKARNMRKAKALLKKAGNSVEKMGPSKKEQKKVELDKVINNLKELQAKLTGAKGGSGVIAKERISVEEANAVEEMQKINPVTAGDNQMYSVIDGEEAPLGLQRGDQQADRINDMEKRMKDIELALLQQKTQASLAAKPASILGGPEIPKHVKTAFPRGMVNEPQHPLGNQPRYW